MIDVAPSSVLHFHEDKICIMSLVALLWTPAQRKRASMLYFADVFYLFIYFFMAALFSGPG